MTLERKDQPISVLPAAPSVRREESLASPDLGGDLRAGAQQDIGEEKLIAAQASLIVKLAFGRSESHGLPGLSGINPSVLDGAASYHLVSA